MEIDNPKFIGKYMRLAKQVGEDKNPCYSRHIGAVLVSVEQYGITRVIGTGYNGPPRGTLHCDEYEYLYNWVYPNISIEEYQESLQHMTPDQKERTINLYTLYLQAGATEGNAMQAAWSATYANCGVCPRHLVGCKSGEHTQLCSCEHAERNAIYNARESLVDTTMFAWCGVPCLDCAKAIVQSGISHIYCISPGEKGGAHLDYDPFARLLLNDAGVGVIQESEEWYLGL